MTIRLIGTIGNSQREKNYHKFLEEQYVKKTRQVLKKVDVIDFQFNEGILMPYKFVNFEESAAFEGMKEMIFMNPTEMLGTLNVEDEYINGSSNYV